MRGVRIGDMQLAVKYLSIAPWAVGNGGVLSKHIFTFSFLESPPVRSRIRAGLRQYALESGPVSASTL